MQSTRFAPLRSAALRAARRCALAAAVATTLVAASCGDDGSPTVERPSDDASGITSTTTPPTTTAPTSSSTSPDGPVAGQRFRVAIKNSAFVPNAITVRSGVLVSWVNEDSTPHTVTADDGSFDQELPRGKGFGRPFNATGTVAYHCKIHPRMTGSVTVQ